ncbi:MAG TPA: hypothetical protein VF265_09365 [Nevskiaceae bacterium]
MTKEAPLRQEKRRTWSSRSAPDGTRNRSIHGHRGAMRTAWIIGGIALAFYGLALVMGHDGHLYTSWHPARATATATATAAPPGAPAVTRSQTHSPSQS